MKKLIAILLSGVLLLTGCANNVQIEPTTSNTSSAQKADTESTANDLTEEKDGLIHVIVEDDESADDSEYVYEPEFSSLNDSQLQAYVEDALYSELVSTLDSDKYYVENVSAVYVSQEYIDELGPMSRFSTS